jgi:peroxiredoxin
MRHPRIATLFILCGLAGLLDAPGVAQETHPAERSAPPPARADTGTDEVLETIAGAVDLDDAQMEQIVSLYRAFRDEQAKAQSELRGRRGNRGERNRPSPEARKLYREHLERLSAQFLAECRALLEPDQLDAWDDCAIDLNLSPRRRGSGRRGLSDRAPLTEPGMMAPDFELRDLNGKRVTLSSLRGKPVVLEFGSYTCPIFRGKVEAIEKVRRVYGGAVHWVLVYTKEAHASDEGRVSQKNVREGIEVPQHASFEQRVASARVCRQALGLKIPILVDDFNNTVSGTYAGFPNRGFVLDADGRIVSRQQWIKPDHVRQALDHILSGGEGPALIIDPEPTDRPRRRDRSGRDRG